MDAGRIELAGEDLSKTAERDRNFGMVFQSYSLFPNMPVGKNVAYGLECRKWRREEIRARVDELLTLVHLTSEIEKYPSQLSGGQQQRVALARALAPKPYVLLLDEPLSALDALARNELAPMLAGLCRESGRPVLYVTHSLQEVLQIADHLVMLEAGCVIGSGTPEQVAGALDHPLSPLIDVGAILDCEFHGFDARHNLSELRIGVHPMWVRGDLSSPSGVIRIQIPARDVTLAKQIPKDTSILNCLPTDIVELKATPDGSVFVELDCVGQRLRSRITKLSAERMGLAQGLRVYALIKSVALDVRSI